MKANIKKNYLQEEREGMTAICLEKTEDRASCGSQLTRAGGWE